MSKAKISYESVYYDGKMLFFFSREMNGLFSINFDDNTMKYIKSINSIPPSASYYYIGIGEIKNRIVLAPRANNDLQLFCLEENKFITKTIEIDKSYLGYRFVDVVVKESVVYLIGYQIPFIALYDLSKDTVSLIKLDGLERDFNQLTADNNNKLMNQYFNNRCSSIIGSDLFLACAYTNKMIKISTETLVMNEIEIGNVGIGFSGMVYADGYFWLVPFVGCELVRYDNENNSVERIPLPGSKELNYEYYDIIDWGERIIVLPVKNDLICIINKRNLKVESIDINEFGGKRNSNVKYPISSGIVLDDGSVFFCTAWGDFYILYEKNGMYNITQYEIQNEEHCIEEAYLYNIKHNTKKIVNENEVLDLSKFLNII